ncbi:TonB C-terminal domain-containing protein [Pseudoduganella sp.]|uniref:TonB C-terminal domain-containing protein n=1 Tax=Pseudoduganella sp. TaxID=1880898 RepID=UPI0035AE16A9
MRDSFPFLTRLGLRPDADAKDIRRAYARELKKVDQEADPTGFQELREAYEIALNWHAHTLHEAAQAATASPLADAPAADATPDAEPEPPAAPEPLPDDPYHLSDQVFQKFTSGVALLAERQEVRQPLWKSVLQQSLDDERLLNLTARTIFEARIAHELASGWKPGHETLFVVANDAFEWERDRRRILQFGEAGAMVNRAIDEWKLFESLPPESVTTFTQLINYVRATPEPQGKAGRNDLLMFHQMASNVYTWLAIIIERQTLENWGNAAQEEAQRPEPEPAASMEPMRVAPEPADKSGWAKPATLWPLFFILFLLLRACFNMVEDDNRARRHDQQSSQLKQLPAPANADQPPARQQVDEIRSRIAYVWPASTPVGNYVVEYEVFIDAKGKVLGMNLLRGSGNRDYDAAVKTAISEAPPFPRGTSTVFRLSYGTELNKAETKGKRATKEQLQAVQDEIFYVPGATIEDGELKVRYDLKLDDNGRVIALKKLKASRDPLFDEVVADALKATHAFPPSTLRNFSVEYSRNVHRQ